MLTTSADAQHQVGYMAEPSIDGAVLVHATMDRKCKQQEDGLSYLTQRGSTIERHKIAYIGHATAAD